MNSDIAASSDPEPEPSTDEQGDDSRGEAAKPGEEGGAHRRLYTREMKLENEEERREREVTLMNMQPAKGQGNHNPNKYRLFFEKEHDAEIEERKRLSRLPLNPVSPVCEHELR